jgi:hypothetical protein
MRQLGIVILGIMFLLLAHDKAFSDTQGGLFGAVNAYKQDYADYTKAVRTKIGYNMSKRLDVGEEGTVSLDFVLSSDGRLIQVSVNNVKTKASQKMISTAIMAVKQSAPFDPFPESMARSNSQLPFNINLNLRPANAQL